jgi:hypothetical protein
MLAEQQPDVRVVLQELVDSIDTNILELGRSVQQISSVAVPYQQAQDNDGTRAYLDYIGEALAGRKLLDR